MSVFEFERMTPRELWMVVDNYTEKRQQEKDDLMIQAYMTAALYRTSKMPKLEALLEEQRPKQPAKQQTPEEMFAAALNWHASLKAYQQQKGG